MPFLILEFVVSAKVPLKAYPEAVEVADETARLRHREEPGAASMNRSIFRCSCALQEESGHTVGAVIVVGALVACPGVVLKPSPLFVSHRGLTCRRRTGQSLPISRSRLAFN